MAIALCVVYFVSFAVAPQPPLSNLWGCTCDHEDSVLDPNSSLAGAWPKRWLLWAGIFVPMHPHTPSTFTSLVILGSVGPGLFFGHSMASISSSGQAWRCFSVSLGAMDPGIPGILACMPPLSLLATNSLLWEHRHLWARDGSVLPVRWWPLCRLFSLVFTFLGVDLYLLWTQRHDRRLYTDSLPFLG
jgi:hypothetical protein